MPKAPQPPGSPKTGLIIGVPSIGWQTTLFLKHLMCLVMPLNTVVTYKFLGTRRYGDEVRPIAEADNLLLHEALQEGAQYLLSLEEDVIAPAMAIRQLMATAGRYPHATVVAAVVTSKTMPPEPMIYRDDGLGAYWGFQRGEVFEAASVHMGCTLIRLADLRDMDVPLVEVQDYPTPGQTTAVREFFRTTGDADLDGKTHESQDIHFCRLLRAAGKKVLVDANVQCGHWDHQRQLLFGLPAGGPPIAGPYEAVNLGCGLDWDFLDGIKPLRVDINEVNKPDFRADLRALPPTWTGRFDIVFSGHVLEHFDRYELPKVFVEMVRVCKPGGEVRLEVPSLDWAIEQLVKSGGKMDGRVIDVIWGGRSVPAVGPYPQMYHKMGLSRATIGALAGQHKLVGRSQLAGYSEQYRLFKPPVRQDVTDWLTGRRTDDFVRRFVGTPAPDEVAVAEGTQEPVEEQETEPQTAAEREEVLTNV